jgi:ATP-dependent DNA helicase RecG
MHRLLQGDVGCGKTAVALYAILAALADSRKHYQAALMAPTEILAEQHFLTVTDLLRGARVRTRLLRGGLPARERRLALAEIAAGEVDLVVGTHALIQQDVAFRRLAFVVIDEQHRFGVRQRLALRRKGPVPDVLIMTATPIPRSLSLVFFGDLDVSVIDQMPPGRRPINTRVVPPADWDEAFRFARYEIERGRQAYIVYPLVEESETLDVTSATEGFRTLSEGPFKGLPCALLHGQMPQDTKREIMEQFRAGRYRCLIATTVIEVGIDVPNATVMIIQHAERLGLAQLHQLRGRVGRGEHDSHCLLLADPRSDDARRRLEVAAETCDGFRIAEEDLRLRGPGEFLGTRQSGLPDVRLLDLSLDTRLLDEARREARRIVEADPDLITPPNRILADRVRARFRTALETPTIG